MLFTTQCAGITPVNESNVMFLGPCHQKEMHFEYENGAYSIQRFEIKPALLQRLHVNTRLADDS